MTGVQTCALPILELFAQDVQDGLDNAINEKQQELVRFVEGTCDKYWITMVELRTGRISSEEALLKTLKGLAYT